VSDATLSNTRPLFILCSGRSFSSVVCGMLGQHPELYGLPEMNFFVADTIGGLFDWFRQAGPGNRHRLDGLARAIAQLHSGEQSETSLQRAWQWLHAHADLSTAQLAHAIANQLQNRALVEKSPSNSVEPACLDRLHATFPQARILHLLRHPRPTGQSIHEAHRDRAKGRALLGDARLIERNWLKVQGNILRFTATLPPGQAMRLRGEDLLADPPRYLRQICAWLEIRTDAAAINAMLHPEDSPYACVGPPNARSGNNRKYLEDPRLRPFKPRPVNLTDPVEWMNDGSGFSPATIALARSLGYR